MQDKDKAEFALLMTSIAEVYSKRLTQNLLKIYWNSLKQYTLVEIRCAVSQFVIDPDVGQFMPKPADIIRLIDGGNQKKILHAWSEVTRAIRLIGAYSCIVFDDPIIHSTIDDMGGWINLCKTQEKDLPFKFNEFEKRYSQYLQKRPTHYPKKLFGIYDQTIFLNSNDYVQIKDDQTTKNIH